MRILFSAIFLLFTLFGFSQEPEVAKPKQSLIKTDEEKAKITDNASAIALMLEKTSVIKRPIVESDKILAMGFKVEEYDTIFGWLIKI